MTEPVKWTPQTMGRKGGLATKKRHPEHFSKAGKVGGRKNADTHPPEHFVKIGKKGGAKVREAFAALKKELEG